MRIAYYRVSTRDQSIEAQRTVMGGSFDREYSDEGVSGGTLAANRPGFSKLLEQVRPGDSLHVYAVDRLGRDTLDIQTVVRRLIERGVIVDVHGVGPLVGEVGGLLLAVLAQFAEMEKRRIADRTASGREAARKSLAETGRTHRGKDSLGRPFKADSAAVAKWRRDSGASISATADHFQLSRATVKRYCAATPAVTT